MRNVGFFDIRDRFRTGIAEMSHRWGWYLLLGIVLIVIGLFAASYAYYATLASVIVLGWILLFEGVTMGVLSFTIGRWSGFLMSMATGILSIITGLMLLRSPLAGATVLTLLIASFLLVTGIFRAISSIVMQFPNWGWSLFSGIVAILLGLSLAAGWPTISLWFLGFFVGIDLIVDGFSWVMFALSVRGLRRLGVREERERPRAA